RQLPLAEVLEKLGLPEADSVVTMPPPKRVSGLGSPAYYFALAGIVRATRPESVLEFGTFRGVSALTMASNMPEDGMLFTVDLPDDATPDSSHELNAIDETHVRSSRHRVGEAFLGSAFGNRIRQIRADSMAFDARQHVKSCGLVLVDGGHSLPLVTRDTENAFQVLAPGGTIIWDDYFYLYQEVVEFLDKLADTHHLVGIEGTNTVIHNQHWRLPGGDSSDEK
ncbi:MAG: class I SAM-dependent methyltransferase, partial [Chthoniobacteraceae bacterium]